MQLILKLTATLVGGVAAGSAAWLVAGSAPASELSSAEALLTRPVSAAVRSPAQLAAADLGRLAARPVFNPNSEPPRPLNLVLRGLARSNGVGSALISVDGGQAAWLRIGQARDGLRLVKLTSSGATVETPAGNQDLTLSAPSAAPPGPGAVPATGPAPKMAPGAAEAEAQIKSIFGRNTYPPPPTGRP